MNNVTTVLSFFLHHLKTCLSILPDHTTHLGKRGLQANVVLKKKTVNTKNCETDCLEHVHDTKKFF